MPIALITGGSRGLGKNTALKLGEKGVDVLLTYRSEAEEAQKVVKRLEDMGRKALALRLDVAEVSKQADFVTEVKDALKHHFESEQFDYFVNNAGIGLYSQLAETTEEQFDQLMNIHLKGPFFLTQKLLPFIADGGRIVNLSTGLTRFAYAGYGAYAAMKGAVEVLTRYQAKEFGARGIAVNTVAPGAIETDFGGGSVRDNASLNQMIASQTSLGRVGLPDDIGGVIAGLLSEDNRWVNAQRIEVSGGIHI